jgi:hypothetical protein
MSLAQTTLTLGHRTEIWASVLRQQGKLAVAKMARREALRIQGLKPRHSSTGA